MVCNIVVNWNKVLGVYIDIFKYYEYIIFFLFFYGYRSIL